MSFLNYHQGCGNISDCMGPNNPFYTIFNTQLEFIHYPLLFSLIPTAIAFIILLILKKKNIINLPNKKIIILLIALYIISFIWFANWTWVVY